MSAAKMTSNGVAYHVVDVSPRFAWQGSKSTTYTSQGCQMCKSPKVSQFSHKLRHNLTLIY